MLILKHNTLSVQDLFAIERQFVRWLDNKGPRVTLDTNVLDLSRTDTYAHLLGIFKRLNVFETTGVTPSEMLDFFIDIDANYLDSPYHSFYHAVDIVTMLYHILTDLPRRYLSPLDIAALLLAALCHDVGHPGYNNLYQVNFNTPLAQRYKNTSVLENYSVDITRDLIHKHKLLRNITIASGTGTGRCVTEAEFVDYLEQLILSTDMVYHYELQEQAQLLQEAFENSTWLIAESGIARFHHLDAMDRPIAKHAESVRLDRITNDPLVVVDKAHTDEAQEEVDDDNDDDSDDESEEIEEKIDDIERRPLEEMSESILNETQRRSLCCILLHAADISNTVRPWPISKRWSDLIVKEFFQQGDAEKQAGLEVSPGMDREQSNQFDISLKFGDFVVTPYFEAIARLLPWTRVFLDILAENRQQWLQLKEQPTVIPSSPPIHERHFPSTLMPTPPVLNPSGRRVSVPAGITVIPDDVSRSAGQPSAKRRRLLGTRSASHPEAIPALVLSTRPNIELEMLYRRKSEQCFSSSYTTHHLPVVFQSSSFDTNFLDSTYHP
ncbi:uncharacterized protein BYT42DRAFT_500532 [Radiomyces spectabilis]|uniref:uncharacterized protein n=1 Tax=Radiomyces spectabilis TaxID=64574 RepID=UPI00221ED5C2|nr:uncharacterized protein BYT42DRAFT_500532 [Radiomyces spectabilis]KAI8372690.1 hypothetical protein BYT42DRAFT_500532 [Radiomyces spectabilis]